ncbi:MAG: hypothetical protein VX777_01670 [Chlamydiota bacterium]|nr:hypothetical protein [Chlamydiota bacterium]
MIVPTQLDDTNKQVDIVLPKESGKLNSKDVQIQSPEDQPIGLDLHPIFKNIGKTAAAAGSAALSSASLFGIHENISTLGSSLINGPEGAAIDKIAISISQKCFPGILSSFTHFGRNSYFLANSLISQSSHMGIVDPSYLSYTFANSALQAGGTLALGAGGAYLTYRLISSMMESNKPETK